MALVAPAYRQQLQENHDEGSLSPWCKIATNMRASSETSQHQRTARTAAAASPAPRQSPTFRRRRRPKPHTDTQKKLDAAARPTIPAGGASTALTSADYCDGPLSFPAPKFSLAVKVVSDDEGYILVSQTTGRRWVAISSARKCQFGEVLRAAEITEEISEGPPTYFAIKVTYRAAAPYMCICCSYINYRVDLFLLSEARAHIVRNRAKRFLYTVQVVVVLLAACRQPMDRENAEKLQ